MPPESRIASEDAPEARMAPSMAVHFYRGVQLGDEFHGVAIDDTLSPIVGFDVSDEDAYIAAIHPDDREAYLTALGYESMAVGVPIRLEYRVTVADGSEIVVAETLVPVAPRPDGGIDVFGVVVDITAERMRERVLASLVEQLSLYLYEALLDPARGTRTLTWESPLETVYPAGDDVLAFGAFWSTALDAETRTGYDEDFLRALHDQPAAAIGYIVQHPTRGSIRCEERAQVLGRTSDGRLVVRGFVRDVTHEHELTEHQRRLAALVDSLGLYLYAGGYQADGRFVETTSTGAMEVIAADRLEPGDDAEAFWRSRVHPDDLERYDAHDDWVVDDLAPRVIRYRILRPDGEVRWVEDRGFASLGAGETIQLEGVITDVTELVESQTLAAESDRRLAKVLENVDMVVATIAFDGSGGYLERYRGPGLERLLGCGSTPDDPWAVLAARVVDADRVAYEDSWRSLAAGRASTLNVRVEGLDGVERHVLIRAFPRPDDGDHAVVADVLLEDVTERERSAAALAAARDAAERQLRIDSLTGVFNRIHLTELLETTAAGPTGLGGLALLILDLDFFKRINDAYLHAAGDRVLCEAARRLVAAARAGDIVGRYGGEEFVVILHDVPDLPTAERIAERLRRSIASTPFALDGDCERITASAGLALADSSDTPETLLDAADRALYAAKRSGRDQLRTTSDLSDAELLGEEPEAIRIAEAMSRAASAREGETELHCASVASLAGAVARDLGLGPATQLRTRLAGLLHDIGKVAVPDAILTKPGRLDDAEWDVMRQHAAFGGEIVARIGGLSAAAPAVRHHHERYDGGGYPDGLAGDAIPVEARIICAVDSFSAMVEPRVYRTAMTEFEALAELRRTAGSQFDPTVVESLARVLAQRPQAARAA